MMWRSALACLFLCVGVPRHVDAQRSETSADSARADLALLRRADAARTRGAGVGGERDAARPTIHEFVDHACPSCRAFVRTRGDSLLQLATAERVNLVFRVSPIPGLLRGAHAAEAAFCAGAVGGAAGFDRVHHALFEEQDRWRYARDVMPRLLVIANDATLDSVAFARCLRTGAMRPLVLSDARLAGQLAVDGTPTLIVTRRGALANSVRVVGDPAMRRVLEALLAAEAPAPDEPTAFAIIGQWRLDSLDVFRWERDTTAAGARALSTARDPVMKTLASIQSGALVIETVFEPSARYRHALRRGANTVYEELGTWVIPGLTGQLHVMSDSRAEGTYHYMRVVGRTDSTLVLERHFTAGTSRGLAERMFLKRHGASELRDPRSPR